MFEKGSKVVHPMYGAGTVEDIEDKIVDGETKAYCTIKISVNDLRVSLAMSKAQELREVFDKNKLFNIIAKAEIRPLVANEKWTVLYKSNLERIKSGDVSEVASVIKYLVQKERRKSLSAIEKKTLCSARQILLSEIILSCGVQKSEAENMLTKLVN